MSDSFWKKEISFGRKPKPEPEVAQPEVADAVKNVLAPDPLPASAPAAEVAPDAVPAPVPDLAPEIGALPGVSGDYGWLTQTFDPNDVPDEMPTIVAPLVSLPGPVPPPLALDLDSVSAPAPNLQGAPEPEPEPEPQDAVVDSPSAPFWKKELSFSRGAKAPKAKKQPKAPKIASGQSVPFWKKELSFGKKQQPAETVATAAVPAAPKVKKPPLWKRELKFSKSAKADDAPTVVGAKGPKQPREKRAKAPRGGNADLVGLKIGSSQIAAARVSNANAAPELLQIGRAPLEEGVVVGGELRDVDALAEALKDLFGKHKLPKRNVRLGIANNRIGVRTFEIAGIDDPKQLANAIKFRAQETLPIPLEEAVLDWRILSESTNDETGEMVRRVLLVVAYRELVERYVDACRKAGIRIVGIDLEAFAMLRALSAPLAADAPAATGAQVVVNVGHDRSTFAVSDGRACEFTRVLGWGGQHLSVAIERALEISPAEATTIKHALSLVAQSAPPEGIPAESLGAAREAVTRELQTFARELVSSLRFYQNQPGSLGIGELVLTGGSAHLPGFSDELQRLIGVPVTVGDPLNRVVIPKKFREPEYAVGSLTVAIGLGIED